MTPLRQQVEAFSERLFIAMKGGEIHSVNEFKRHVRDAFESFSKSYAKRCEVAEARVKELEGKYEAKGEPERKG